MLPEKQKYDPWETQQEITDIKILLHCSRYWMLSEWECENMSYPFWRLYHSRTGGSFVNFDGIESELTPNTLLVIPPDTSFSTKIRGFNKQECIRGVRIKSELEIDSYKMVGMSDQFFIHFNLGFPYDRFKPGVYNIEIDEQQFKQLVSIENERLQQPDIISLFSAMKLNALILFALQNLPAAHWTFPDIDKRILKAINFIDKNINSELSNATLSNMVHLAPNSFARLFRDNLNSSVQQYIRHRRIEHAIMLLHHSDVGIDEIAQKCGFYDRHHFSKVFKSETGLPPVNYRSKIKGK